MGATVGVGGRWINMTNGSWEAVVDNALAVARERADSDLRREYVARLERQKEGFFPGYCPDFEDLFPTDDERTFWCVCFRDAGRWLCTGRLKNPLWGGSPALAVFHVYWCAELLLSLLRASGSTVPLLDEDTLLREEARKADSEAYRVRHEEVMRQDAKDVGPGSA